MTGLPQNNSVLNRAALRWLEEAKAEAPPWYLHLLNLAAWGLENGQYRHELQDQVSLMFGWKPKHVMTWILAHPDGLPREEQEVHILNLLQTSPSPARAAHHVLETIWDKQVSQNGALRR